MPLNNTNLSVCQPIKNKCLSLLYINKLTFICLPRISFSIYFTCKSISFQKQSRLKRIYNYSWPFQFERGGCVFFWMQKIQLHPVTCSLLVGSISCSEFVQFKLERLPCVRFFNHLVAMYYYFCFSLSSDLLAWLQKLICEMTN